MWSGGGRGRGLSQNGIVAIDGEAIDAEAMAARGCIWQVEHCGIEEELRSAMRPFFHALRTAAWARRLSSGGGGLDRQRCLWLAVAHYAGFAAQERQVGRSTAASRQGTDRGGRRGTMNNERGYATNHS